MEIVEGRSGGVLVVALRGRLDTTTSPDLEKRLLGHVDAGARQVVLDLEGIEYISSAGLRVLLLVAKKLRTGGGDVVLCALGPAVRQVFELAGFLSIFPIEPSRAAAVERAAIPR